MEGKTTALCILFCVCDITLRSRDAKSEGINVSQCDGY